MCLWFWPFHNINNKHLNKTKHLLTTDYCINLTVFTAVPFVILISISLDFLICTNMPFIICWVATCVQLTHLMTWHSPTFWSHVCISELTRWDSFFPCLFMMPSLCPCAWLAAASEWFSLRHYKSLLEMYSINAFNVKMQ